MPRQVLVRNARIGKHGVIDPLVVKPSDGEGKVFLKLDGGVERSVQDIRDASWFNERPPGVKDHWVAQKSKAQDE